MMMISRSSTGRFCDDYNWPLLGDHRGSRKLATIFNPAPIVLVNLQAAAAKAQAATKLSAEIVTRVSQSKAWNKIERAHDLGDMSEDLIEAIRAMASVLFSHREPEA